MSFAKGCYVGQEVVARLDTYDKVSRRLVGLRLPAGAPAPAPGTTLARDGRPIGEITSAVADPRDGAAIALAYVKRRGADVGDEVAVGGGALRATLVELPFPVGAAGTGGAPGSA